MLDVAACAELLIEGHTAFSKLSIGQRRAFVILVALHDVGKLSTSFRDLVRKNTRGAPLHWQLSDFLLCGTLDEVLSALGSDQIVRAELYAAVAGHHGKPPNRASGDRIERLRRNKAIGVAHGVARTWVSTLLELFPNASLNGITEHDAKTLSWALSGLTVVSDWLGSNQTWFPVEMGECDFDEALETSRMRAREAIEKSGIIPPLPNSHISGAPLGMKDLRPMQTVASNVKLSRFPQLAVIEDSTGTGKTEAALILAHRMIEKRLGRGIFFALPTMATSNAMFDRMWRFTSKMFNNPPTLILTHSRAKLSESFRTLFGADTDNTPEATGTDWLTDSKRRAVLANIGVGTVDQALLSILPSRFSTLRVFGLSDKVLIVDEAHSYDPYMREELKTLLTMHAQLGGSAILMTATLPITLRREFVSAFQIGCGSVESLNSSHQYPSFHLVSKEINSFGVEPLEESVRRIRIKRFDTVDSVLQLAVRATNTGAVSVWVRNAVDDAIETVQTLKRMGVVVDLLHARFAMCDRLDREREVMEAYGKSRNNQSGRLLIATQVVEASLDLDFDVMISDLAPIGSLIQRTGRLWRHMIERPTRVRPVREPILNVLSPDPNKVLDENWLVQVLDKGAWVYRLDEQWRTAKVLFDTGEIVAPSGLRALIEAVHGKSTLTVPKVLENASIVSEGEAVAEKGFARRNVVEVHSGYLNGTRGAVSNDSTFPTRLGIQQITIVLARRERNQLIPWARSDDLATAWSLSEISVSKEKFERLLPNQNVREIDEIKNDWPKWRREECQLAIVEDDGLIGEHLTYDKLTGLHFSKSP